MRLAMIAVVAGTIATAALASPPYANELLLPSGAAAARPAEDAGIPKVMRGQILGLACAEVAHAASDAVRVVLSLASNERPTGYSGVLAIDQMVSGGMVHVRVPDLPDLVEHTVHIMVYVSDKRGMHSCDAGQVRIV